MYVLNTINSATQCSVMLPPVQWNAATECNVMLPPSVQGIIHAEGVRCRAVAVRSGRCPVRVRESKVLFADHTPGTCDGRPIDLSQSATTCYRQLILNFRLA